MPNDDRPVQGKELIEVTRDESIIQGCSAVVITGGTLIPRTEAIAVAAAKAGKPVFYVELAYGSDVQHERNTDWLTHAFTGSDYSRHQISTHLGIEADKIHTIGYPHLDGLARPDVQKRMGERKPNNVLLLGTVNAQEINGLLQITGKAFQRNGFRVTARKHPRDETLGWDGFEPSSGSLIDDLINNDIVVGIPGTAFLAAAASNKIIWHPEHSEYSHLMPNTHLTRLSSPLFITNVDDARKDVEDAIATYEPLNPDIKSHIVGPVDGKAAERLWQGIYTTSIDGL